VLLRSACRHQTAIVIAGDDGSAADDAKLSRRRPGRLDSFW
jgi:hypothetical protein